MTINYLRRYLPELTLGSIDGLVTTFAVISGSEGGHLGVVTIIILSLANVFADGFSMSVSVYFSIKNDKRDNGKLCMSSASATFLGFITTGMLPVMPYLLFGSGVFIYSMIISAILFLLIGAMKGILDHHGFIRQSLFTLLFGGISCCIAYFLGFLIDKII
jgi:VIT1/CCC1 family predicted Fe2+/Mn2+ transporter